MRTAILFSGMAYSFRFSVKSLMENLVIPNDADVFIFTTKENTLRRTPAGPIPDSNDPDRWHQKTLTQERVDDTITDEDVELIRGTFGDRLKVLAFAEDDPAYMDYLAAKRIEFARAVGEYHNSETVFDVGHRSLVDQFNHVKHCYELMQQYEAGTGVYDMVMRARLDFIAPEPFVLAHYYLQHDAPYLFVCGDAWTAPFYWEDEYCWFSKRETADRLFSRLDMMGFITDRKYDTIYKGGEYRFSAETQFDLLLHELDIDVSWVRVFRSSKYVNHEGYDYHSYMFRRQPIDLCYEFEQACKGPSDINEHLRTLKIYGQWSEHITELGTRYGNSTIAFMATNPVRFVSYDVAWNERIDYLKLVAKEARINFEFRLENPQEIEPTDLLFIDTDHHAEQCSKELALHADKVRKWIIFHDTTTFWENGQGGAQGLRYAIEPFLEAHPEWEQHQRYHNNNGLLILKRWTLTRSPK